MKNKQNESKGVTMLQLFMEQVAKTNGVFNAREFYRERIQPNNPNLSFEDFHKELMEPLSQLAATEWRRQFDR